MARSPKTGTYVPHGRPKGRKDMKPRHRKAYSMYKPIEYTRDQIAELKKQIILLFENRKALTLSQAADKLGIYKTQVYHWVTRDEEFAAQLHQIEQIQADDWVQALQDNELKMPQVIALMFLIKKIRPEYRDSYRRVEVVDPDFNRTLQELREAGAKQLEPEKQPKVLQLVEGTLIPLEPEESTTKEVPTDYTKGYTNENLEGQNSLES